MFTLVIMHIIILRYYYAYYILLLAYISYGKNVFSNGNNCEFIFDEISILYIIFQKPTSSLNIYIYIFVSITQIRTG